jgi:transcriptional regulator with XRE-family HTH domain
MARSDRNVGLAAKQAALKALGARLQEARSGISLTQEAVAEKLGVSSQTVRNWEAGRTEPSRFDKERLAALYGKPVEWFFGEEQPAVSTDDIDIADPELALFFRGEWDEFTEEEKEFLKGMIRESRELLRKRKESGQQ